MIGYEAITAEVDHPGYDFVTGFASIQEGDRDEAVKAAWALHGAFPDDSNPRGAIMRMELDALLALDEGDGALAVELLEEAATLEESLPFEFGPPASLKPPHELLGEVKLELGDHVGALAAFRRSLDFTPERTLSLRGLVFAADALDEHAE